LSSIAHLPDLVAALSPTDRATVERLFHISVTTGVMNPEPSFYPKLESLFGSAQDGLRQPVVKVTNLVTLDSSLFNPLRAARPHQTIENITLDSLIEQGRATDQFTYPLRETAPDVFGRLETDYAITASNIAKVDGWSGVIIFKEFHPHRFSREQVIDYLMTGRAWAEKAVEHDPLSPYFFLLWNCLWKAGASQIHGHAQALLTRGMHYGHVERLRRDALSFEATYRRNYFAELVNASRALGLTADPADRVKALVSLTPLRDREIWLITDNYSPELGEAIYKTLSFYLHSGVTSFNVGIQMPPIRPVSENWSGFPVIARLVARGNPLNRQNDTAGTELFATTVISSDPLKVAESYRAWLRQK